MHQVLQAQAHTYTHRYIDTCKDIHTCTHIHTYTHAQM